MKRKQRDHLEVTATSHLCQLQAWRQCHSCQHLVSPSLLQILHSFPSAIIGVIVEFTHDDLPTWMHAQFAPSQDAFMRRISFITSLSCVEKRRQLSVVTRNHYREILHLCEALISKQFHPFPIPATTVFSFSQQEVHHFFQVLEKTLETLALELNVLSPTRSRQIKKLLVEKEFILKAHLTSVDELTGLVDTLPQTLGKTQRDHLRKYCASLLRRKTKKARTV